MIYTTIYFLVDTRTRRPFYCGKTTLPLPAAGLPQRFEYLDTSSPLAKRIKKCGKHIQVRVVAVVPPTEDANAKYRAYLTWLITNFPDCANQKLGRKVSRRRNQEAPSTFNKRRRNIETRSPFNKRKESEKRKMLVAERNRP